MYTLELATSGVIRHVEGRPAEFIHDVVWFVEQDRTTRIVIIVLRALNHSAFLTLRTKNVPSEVLVRSDCQREIRLGMLF